MEEEKKEMERGIVVLDEGIEKDAFIGPDSVCCGAFFIPARG